MNYVTRRSHRMQKHKFSVTSPGALLVESVLVPPKYDKECLKVSCPERSGMHYVTHRSHRMQKHKFGVSCPVALFVESEPIPPEHDK
jgi:hypothetical protein